MASDRDLFANFERMRREMDELFGDVFGAGGARGLASRGAFSPAVDVYYVADPPRAVVRAELAGIRAAELELEIRGRELILAGQRRPAGAEEERLYQQLEVQHGPFRRVVALGADVDADAASARYEDGFLIVELPLVAPAGGRRTVPIERAGVVLLPASIYASALGRVPPDRFRIGVGRANPEPALEAFGEWLARRAASTP